MTIVVQVCAPHADVDPLAGEYSEGGRHPVSKLTDAVAVLLLLVAGNSSKEVVGLEEGPVVDQADDHRPALNVTKSPRLVLVAKIRSDPLCLLRAALNLRQLDAAGEELSAPEFLATPCPFSALDLYTRRRPRVRKLFSRRDFRLVVEVRHELPYGVCDRPAGKTILPVDELHPQVTWLLPSSPSQACRYRQFLSVPRRAFLLMSRYGWHGKHAKIPLDFGLNESIRS